MRTRPLGMTPILALLLGAAPATASDRATLEFAVGPSYGIQTRYDRPYGLGGTARLGAPWEHFVLDTSFTYFGGSERSYTSPDPGETASHRYFGVVDAGYQDSIGGIEARAFLGLGHIWQHDTDTPATSAHTPSAYDYDWWILSPGVSIAYPVKWFRIGFEARGIVLIWPLTGNDPYPPPLQHTVSFSLFVGGAFQL